MKLRKTDKRFNLYHHGFDCYVEFNSDDWRGWNRTVHCCRENLGDEFWEFSGRVYNNGNWKGVVHHRGSRWNSKRVYLRGEEYYTMLLLFLPSNDSETVYSG